MSAARTPQTAQGCEQLLYDLNLRYNLDLPVEKILDTPSKRKNTAGDKCVAGLGYLHFKGASGAVLRRFGDQAKQMLSEWIHKPNQDRGTTPSSSPSFIKRGALETFRNISSDQRVQLVQRLSDLIDEEMQLVKSRTRTIGRNGSIRKTAPSGQSPPVEIRQEAQARPQAQAPRLSPTKRKAVPDINEVFTATPTPSSSSQPTLGGSEFDDDDLDNLLPLLPTDNSSEDQTGRRGRSRRIDHYFKPISKSTPDASPFDAGPASSPPQATGRQTTVQSFMRVSKAMTNSQAQNVNGNKCSHEEPSSTAESRASSSFLGGTSTVATSFSSTPDYPPTWQMPGYFQDSSPEATELLRSEEFLADLSPEPQFDYSAEKVAGFISQLEASGPFAKHIDWPRKIPLRYRYEVERVSQAKGLSVDQILPRYDIPSAEYAEFWKHISREPRELPNKDPILVEKTKTTAWETAVGNFAEKGTSDVVTLTGDLEWSPKSEPGLLKLNLKPLRLERSHRFARRFGSDRFMEITFPALSKSPDYLKQDGPIVLRSIATWLATGTHHLLGRTWRAFYLEDIKRKRRKDESPRSKVHIFAVDGSDFRRSSSPLPSLSPENERSDAHTPMSVEALFNWHIPIEYNKKQKDFKLFQRLSLALSRTIPTVVLRQGQIIHKKDPEKGPVMNDGCALISVALASQIKDALGLEDENPCCFQGRIGGAKGIWMVDSTYRSEMRDKDIWIEITDSQQKIYPHPSDADIYHVLDESQRTFEVVSWSRELHPVNLNTQLLMVLQHGGVQTQRLQDLVQREVNVWYEDFKKTITNEIVSRAWIQKQGQGLSEKRKTRRIEDFPSENIEQTILLLDSGFHPLKLPYLKELLTNFLKDYCDRLDSLKVRIPESTYAYCIADPYEVLAEDEVHFGFSKPWDSNGYTDLDGMDVLIGRNPAHLPNDIQKRRVVFKKELRHFKDVIVFPSVGKVPLAGMLSGGDYDGDSVWVCWDIEFVREFNSTPFDPDKVPPPEAFGLKNLSEKLKEPFNFDEYLTKAFVFNASPSPLGICTNEHEKLCYYENGICSAGAVRLAHLLGHLADVRKTGYELKREVWDAEWLELSRHLGSNVRRKPAYKQTDEDEDDGRYLPDNIIDKLKFEVVRDEKHRILTNFHKFCQDHETPPIDSDLVAIWNQTRARSITERDELNDMTLLKALDEIQSQVLDVKEKRPYRRSGIPTSTIISATADLIQNIKPPICEHELSHTWQNSDASWQMLLASCVYYCAKRHDDYFPWFAAGPTLCEIKARATGQFRMVTMPVYKTFRVNHRAAKKAIEAAEGSRAEIEKMILDLKDLEDQFDPENVQDDFDEWRSFAS